MNRAKLSGRSWDPDLGDMFSWSGDAHWELSRQLNSGKGPKVGGLQEGPGHHWAQL